MQALPHAMNKNLLAIHLTQVSNITYSHIIDHLLSKEKIKG